MTLIPTTFIGIGVAVVILILLALVIFKGKRHQSEQRSPARGLRRYALR